ncbi:hypothetical protein PAEPH01_2607 [Pancytospora epiphaga]|nr:hypothetical protein PAEPH01_2607 [Pancytospora epiphaga]
MDEIEKELKRRYGNGVIPAKETRSILQMAYNLNLINHSDVRELASISSAEMLRHISEIRREFLLDGNTITFSNEEYQQAYDSRPGEDSHFIDKILETYFEYAKMVETPRKQRSNSNLFIIIILLAILIFLYISYTPRPY